MHHIHGEFVAPWMRGLKAAVGLTLALTTLLFINLIVYQRLRQFAPYVEAPQVDELLRFLVVTDLVAVVILSGLALWLNRQLGAREAADRVASAAHTEQEVQLRGQVVELTRLNQKLLAENADQRRFRGQLRRLQKMETLGKLVGGVSHEFNNYLTVIVGFSEQLLQQLPPGTMEHLTVVEILNAGERSAELTHGLLDLIRGGDGSPQPIDINHEVDGMRRMLGVVLGKRVRLDVVLQAGLPLVEAVPGQFEQVLLNLATNARDAMPDGGQLRIETSAVELSLPHDGVPPGRYVVISATDTGCGIRDDALERLFEPFFTTKQQGAGLGLAMARDIVAASQGSIVVDSLPGHGATFKVYWPVGKLQPENGLRSAHETSQVPISGRETLRMKIDEIPFR